MYLGAAYYPEHVTLDQIKLDAHLMQAAGVNLVRMGEFAWYKMEPEDGIFDFSWMDTAVQILAEHGVQTLLCTPTASPPKWLMDQHPDIFQTYENGQHREWGRRREYCVNNKNYHAATHRIVTALAGHYSKNPNIIGYQIDNELMAEKPYCYCSTCANEFRDWLKNKYGDIKEFNRRCGTAFWGLSYRNWDEIELPQPGQNPSLVLEMYRFFSDSFLKYAALQTEILHRISPGKPVTHNICSSGFINNLDLYKLGEIVDIASLDNYPMGWTLETELRNYQPIPYNPAVSSLALAYTRAVQRAPFWVTEKQIGPGGGRLKPGYPRMWTYQEFAHGGRLFLFFPWRACPFGSEFNLLGILDYDSVPRRRYSEVQQLASELMTLEPLLKDAHVEAHAAILRDFNSDWALAADPLNDQLRYQRHILKYSQALFRNQVQVDVVSPGDDWSKYRLLVVPSLLLVDDALAEKLGLFAQNGGTLLLTFLSGLRDTESVYIQETLPGKIKALAGLEIEEQDNLSHSEPVGIRMLAKDRMNSSCAWWCDIIKPTTASPLAVYNEQAFYAGKPAITVNTWGKGLVYYMGTLPDEQFLQEFMGDLAKNISLPQPVTCKSPLVEVVQTHQAETKFIFVLNFSDEVQTAFTHQTFTNITNHNRMSGEFQIPAMDLVILQSSKESK